MVSKIYNSELQLNKANISDTEAIFLDLHLSISNDRVSVKFYDKLGDFDFEIAIFKLWCSSLYILCSLYLSTHSFC